MRSRFFSVPVLGSILALSQIAFVSSCATPTTQQGAIDPEAVAAERLTQQRINLRDTTTKQLRLQRVAYRVAAANTDLCAADVGPLLGVLMASKADFDEDWEEAVVAEFGLGEHLMILGVVPNSPSDKAGLSAGDELTGFNGKPVPTGTKATEALERFSETAIAGAPYELQYLRDGSTLTTQIVPQFGCSYRAVLIEDDQINAFANGRNIAITKGMMRFIESDEDLAVVVAHEAAHNAEDHIDKKRMNAVGGMVADVALAVLLGVNTNAFANAAAQAYSQEFEAEADYVGLYMTARAGYDPANGPLFWRKMAANQSGSINQNPYTSHPSSPERFVALDNIVREIERKQTMSFALEPKREERREVDISDDSRQSDRDPVGK